MLGGKCQRVAKNERNMLEQFIRNASLRLSPMAAPGAILGAPGAILRAPGARLKAPGAILEAPGAVRHACVQPHRPRDHQLIAHSCNKCLVLACILSLSFSIVLLSYFAAAAGFPTRCTGAADPN